VSHVSEIFVIFAMLVARNTLAIFDFHLGKKNAFAGKPPAPSVCEGADLNNNN
jgi:hypothetical protein